MPLPAPSAPVPSPNFAFLAAHDPRLVALTSQAEAVFAADPVGCLVRLRAFGEHLAKRAAANVALYVDPREPQAELVDRLFARGAITPLQERLFRDLRKMGNTAAHDVRGSHADALHQLRICRELAVWFHRAFGPDPKFKPGPFVPPPDPAQAAPSLAEELARLRREAAAHAREAAAHAEEAAAARRAAEEAQKAAEQLAAERLSAEQQAAKAREEAAVWEALAAERLSAEEQAARAREEAAIWEALAAEHAGAHERAARSEAELAALKALSEKLAAELAALQAAAEKEPPASIKLIVARSAMASEAISLDEAATRRLVDAQLREAGWEADSENLTFQRGARPVKGRNLAIAEWPTEADGKKGRADYALFIGLMAAGVVEAKAHHKNVPSVLEQAKRYARGFLDHGVSELPPGGPWGAYRVPFLFATNGRPFLRQLVERSGIWFLDGRRPKNLSAPLAGWYTPGGLAHLLKQDIDAAEKALATEPMPYIDRDYQRRAILAVEEGLAAGKREMLVAMATGTGKTRMCIGLCYRLIKTKRFRRILFLVDRNALGRQTADALKDLRLENLQSFPDIYDVKEIGDLQPDTDTRLQIATVQAMVRRVLLAPDEEDGESAPGRAAAPPPPPVPVDQYDCIIVDECHRGYLLDREMSDRELSFRNEEDYISKYRRVLDHFDAVKIGLTATPALHTTSIFGHPIYQYSYREAVVDGFLVDHEPPIRIVTRLARDGIHYEAREEVLVLDRGTSTLHKETLPDEVDFDIEDFNRQVLSENFNRAVLGELVNHVDPEEDEKTLIFCATDEHADKVAVLLKEALQARYGAVDEDAVLKITGSADRPLELIRRFRNERLPSVAVTVDLLSTGIDIPRIANLVFLRRVKSRVLYEQMLGRATRLCPDIGKERFRVFDAVDLYAALQKMTDMKPVVVNPQVPFADLALEVLSSADEAHRRESLSELIAKLQRKKRSLRGEALEAFLTAAGEPVEDVLARLRSGTVEEAAAWLDGHRELVAVLDRASGGVGGRPIVSQHEDGVVEVSRGYGSASRPEDYLEGFAAFLRENMNRLPALMVVVKRPRDLTREELRGLRLALDEKGFTEAALRTAWREARSEDVAAGVIGHIRRLALGSPLVPYAERVDAAVARLKKAHALNDVQRRWLDRIADQMKVETVVDRASLDSAQFRAQGGFPRLDKVFEGRLEALLAELADEVWRDAG